MRRTAALLLAFALLCASPRALAQRTQTPLGGEEPTRGVMLADPSLVGSSDASAVEVNPGALGFVPAWSVYLHHTELRRAGRFYGGGDGLWAAVPLPLISSLVVGAGIQWLRPADSLGYDDSAKLSLALAWSWRQMFSLGLAYHALFTHSSSPQNRLQTLDLGLVFRPFEWFGAALVIRDLTSPIYLEELPLQRRYELELMGRPFSSHRLEISAGVRISERRGEVDPRFRLALEPLNGLRLFATVELLRRDYYRDDEPLLDVRATAGAAVRLERLELAVASLVGREMPQRATAGPLSRDAARTQFQGLAAGLRFEGSRREPLVVGSRRILALRLKGELAERDLVRLVALLRRAERRSDVRGVLLHLDQAELGWGQVQELRGWLRRLRGAGKRSYVYLRSPGEKAYLVGTAADRVMLDPAGGLSLNGLALQNIYFKGLLDKVGASAELVRIAEYKAAPEQYTRTTASEPVRKMRRALVDDLFGRLVADLARERKLAPAKVRELIDAGPYTPAQALQAKLVDQLLDPGELERTVQKLSGAQLVRAEEIRRRPDRWMVGPAIAVVLVEGDIVRGKSSTIPLIGRRISGDDSVVAALKEARGDSSVEAVVLRVDSPGGSAMASHRIWQEVVRTRQVKPVVVSLGNVAASGGYYVACGGDRIYAEPSTITGSIGIFSGKLDLSGLLGKLGISIDSESRGKRALLEAWDRPYSEEERAFELKRLRYYYDQFVGAVSQGRGMTREEAEQRARGRVWTGAQAKDKGLVDALGGLGDAVEDARRRAGLAPDRPVRVMMLPRQKKGLVMRAIDLLGRAEGGVTGPEAWIPAQLKPLLRAVPPALLRARVGEPLARMPFELRF